MQLFYHKSLSETDKTLEFDKDESRHIVKVLRHKKGDILHVTNGLGFIFNVRLTEVSQKYCVGVIEARTHQEPLPYYLHIAIAPTKNSDRLEWFLEKVTELGISEITPIICEHSERKIVKNERLFKIVESAVKQSLSSYMPILNEPTDLVSFLKLHENTVGLKGIAHCYDGKKDLLIDKIDADDSFLLLIGPEGDFSTKEIDAAVTLGFQPISLGSRRLRTETAGVFACAQIAAVKKT